MNADAPGPDLATKPFKYSGNTVRDFEGATDPNSAAEWVEKEYGCVGRGYFVSNDDRMLRGDCPPVAHNTETWLNVHNFCSGHYGLCLSFGFSQAVIRKVPYRMEDEKIYLLIPKVFGKPPRFNTSSGYPESDYLYTLLEKGKTQEALDRYYTLLNTSPHLLRPPDAEGICGKPGSSSAAMRDWIFFDYPFPQATTVKMTAKVRTLGWFQYLSGLKIDKALCICLGQSNNKETLLCGNFLQDNCFIQILITNYGSERDTATLSLQSIKLFADPRPNASYENRFDEEFETFEANLNPGDAVEAKYRILPRHKENSIYYFNFELKDYKHSIKETVSVKVHNHEAPECVGFDGDSCSPQEPVHRGSDGFIGSLWIIISSIGYATAGISIAYKIYLVYRKRRDPPGTFEEKHAIFDPKLAALLTAGSTPDIAAKKTAYEIRPTR